MRARKKVDRGAAKVMRPCASEGEAACEKERGEVADRENEERRAEK